jgi:hypothetical protein
MRRNKLFNGLTILIVLVTFDLNGQDYAGPDATICPGTSTAIGGMGSGSFCYKWTPETGLDDPTSPNPTASPTETTTYSVEVTSEDLSFVASDAMTVTVSGIQRIMVTTKKCCWKKNEVLNESDFEVVKIPAAIAGDITFDPPNAPFSSFEGGESSEEIMVKFKCGDSFVAKSVMITVVDEDFEISAAGAQFSANKRKYINKICDIAEQIENKFKVLPLFCQPSVSCTFDIPFTNFSFGKLCCADNKDECVRTNFRLNGITGGISGGAQCYLPYPPIPALNLALSASVSASFSYNPIGADCMANNKQCITVSPSVDFSIGVAGCSGPCDASIVTVQGGGTATFTPSNNLQICWPSGDTEPFSLCGQLDFELSTSFVSLWSAKIKVTLIPKTCL